MIVVVASVSIEPAFAKGLAECIPPVLLETQKGPIYPRRKHFICKSAAQNCEDCKSEGYIVQQSRSRGKAISSNVGIGKVEQHSYEGQCVNLS